MSELREFVRTLLEEKGLKLGEKDISRIVEDLKRWVPKRGKDLLVKTKDGSYTLISSRYGEPYHSITAGAVTECLYKFVVPSRILEKARSYKKIKILDVGFGLGYNTAVALTEVRRVSEDVEVEVVALDINIPERIPPLPEPYRKIHEEILKDLPSYEGKNLKVRLLLGDARETVKLLSGFGADAVFHDPFSPLRNPELWTADFLRLVKEAMSEEGVWVSYTSALPVRKALLDLGFKVGASRPVGRRRGGTVASLKGDVPPLPSEEMEKLRSSPYSVPFRDPDLSWEPMRILAEYRISVFLREISSGEGTKLYQDKQR